ncbi:alanine racemase [Rhodophyticola sp. CCM32]|uniref:alanine racemase n=1 Tax=Rhodophyticola sp. CCM32 TaxID=2916397 RepID=UPI00107FAE7C|nr:alanine racemase [Rhodophyticola sp. CCM32]QBX99759.1 alanine racemase [Rhodophyticola sp. CCM32]
MATGILHIDLDALCANWRALDRLSAGETGAVVKADGYGLGLVEVTRALASAGARRFFVAVAEEGATLRKALGENVEINVFSGHMVTDTAIIRGAGLTPMLNSAAQVARHREALPDAPYGVQLDTGMNRLGMEADEWAELRAGLEAGPLTLVMSHLACADTPEHPQNAAQLAQFIAMTEGLHAPRSLSATGGILLGPEYHFDLTRPGIGLYGGLPFAAARPALRLSLPVIQTRDIAPGETVGYGGTYCAPSPRKIATVSGGYADGLIRALSGRARLFAGDTPCPVVGRVSMDMIGVDVTDLPHMPEMLDIMCPAQNVDALAEAAGTIGYEILTSLGARYERHYSGGPS